MALGKFAAAQNEILNKKAAWIQKVKEILDQRRGEDEKLVAEYNNIGVDAPGFSQSDPSL